MKVDIRKTHYKARIEILPLIDIVFLLLVFFIYAMLSMAVHRGISVNLPVSSTSEIEKTTSLSVTIKDNGDIFVDKQRVSLKDLSRFLNTRIDKNNNTGLFIFADKDVSVQLLLNVMDQIRTSGTSRISLQTVRENRP